MSMLKTSVSSEYAIIQKIKTQCERASAQQFEKAIGDDCAVRNISSQRLLLSSDVSVEGVHFSCAYMSYEEIGYRAIIGNLSDIAAMGGAPDFLSVQLVFPCGESNCEDIILKLYDGMCRASCEYSVPIVGGDLSRGGEWIIAVTVGGYGGSRILYRSGAKSEDIVWVTGIPGLSAAGYDLLSYYGREKAESISKQAVMAHILPQAQITVGQILMNCDGVHACMDISDGIAKEALTISQESAVGMKLFLPQSISHVLSISDTAVRSPKDLFLSGGEDYELIFTADRKFVPEEHGVMATRIGTVYESSMCTWLDETGDEQALECVGWDHFSL